jgi:hypothetical protein
MWATCGIFKKVPKVNNNPMGENWLNLVTLTVSQKPDSAS